MAMVVVLLERFGDISRGRFIRFPGGVMARPDYQLDGEGQRSVSFLSISELQEFVYGNECLKTDEVTFVSNPGMKITAFTIRLGRPLEIPRDEFVAPYDSYS